MSSRYCPCDNRGILEGLISFIDTNDPQKHLIEDTPLKWYRSSQRWARSQDGLLDSMDFGLNGIDVGLNRREYRQGTDYPERKSLLHLAQIGSNTFTGELNLSGLTESGRSDYYSLSGETIDGVFVETLDNGYFQGQWGFQGYNHQVLPNRYEKGFTIGTRIYLPQGYSGDIVNENDGFFLYMGARAENKFYYETCGELFTKTGEGNSLGQDRVEGKGIEAGIEGNALGFRIDSYGNIGYRMLDDDLEVHEAYSCSPLPSGWANIDIWYKPYSEIKDLDILECEGRRLGVLRIYYNGNIIWEVRDFPEPRFFPLLTEREKQLGLPYTLSWGGGTFGLKHAWRFRESETLYTKDIPIQGIDDLIHPSTGDYCTTEALSGDYRVINYAKSLSTSGDTLSETEAIEFKSGHYYKVTVAYGFDTVPECVRTETQGLGACPRAVDPIELIPLTGNTETLATLLRIVPTVDSQTLTGLCDPSPAVSDSALLSDIVEDPTPTPDVRPNRLEEEGYNAPCLSGDTYTMTEIYKPDLDCEFSEGSIRLEFPQDQLELGWAIRISHIEVEEVFYNYECVPDDFCGILSGGIDNRCEDTTPLSGGCGHRYGYLCETDNLLIQKYYDGNLRGASLQKLRIYDRPLLLQEIRANYDLDSSEVGLDCPTDSVLREYPPDAGYTVGFTVGYFS